VEITGFKDVRIKDAKEFLYTLHRKVPKNIWVQFFDAGLVATWQHLYFAGLNALLAFKNEHNISKSLAIEIMLYASAQRQIRKAIDFIGVKCAIADVAMLIIGDSVESVEAVCSMVSRRVAKEPDDSVLEISKEKAERICKAFGVTAAEFKSALEKDYNQSILVSLIIERMALLSTLL